MDRLSHYRRVELKAILILKDVKDCLMSAAVKAVEKSSTTTV